MGRLMVAPLQPQNTWSCSPRSANPQRGQTGMHRSTEPLLSPMASLPPPTNGISWYKTSILQSCQFKGRMKWHLGFLGAWGHQVKEVPFPPEKRRASQFSSYQQISHSASCKLSCKYRSEFQKQETWHSGKETSKEQLFLPDGKEVVSRFHSEDCKWWL